MMGTQRRFPMKNGDEQDAFTGWRRWLCLFDKPGVAKKTKRRFWRRVRRAERIRLKKFPE